MALLAIGGFTPIIAAATATPATMRGVLVGGICILLSLALHLTARLLLRRLRP